MQLDYTSQGRRPTAAQIVAAWKKAGKPNLFTVAYGETFAMFQKYGMQWDDSGNGCRGVDRNAVVKALNAASKVVQSSAHDW